MADISDYITKLVHPIVEIRTRALHSLLQKVEFGLVSQAELTSTHPAPVPHLLKLLHLGPPHVTPHILTLLTFLSEDKGSRAMLGGAGVRQKLRELHAVAPVDLLPQITLLLKKLGHTSSQELPCPSETRLPAAVAPEISDSSLLHSLHTPHSLSLGNDECSEVGGGEESVCDWTTVHDPTDAGDGAAAAVTESPLKFVTFPWQALTRSDQHILESSAQSLMSSSTAEVRASLLFLDTVVLRDFPLEVLLQRPAVLQVVYGCLAEQGEDAWQLQVPACDFLHSLTQLLTARVDHFMDQHTRPGSGEIVSATSSGVTSPSNVTRVTCCSPHSHTGARGDSMQDTLGVDKGQPQPFSGVGQELLGSTVHEQDDGDEFILLGLHQMTVPGHCVQVMRAACPLLASHRPSLQSASLRLVTCSLALLRTCVTPDLLWRPKEEDEEEDEEDPLLTEVIIGVQMVIGTLSDLIVCSVETRQEVRGDRWALIGHCCSLCLCHTLTTLVPVEAATQVLDTDAVCEAVVMVLCDGAFYLQHPQYHNSLLQYLNQTDPTASSKVRCLLYAAKCLQATSTFLQASDSDLEAFLDLAEEALPSCSVVQDDAFLERLLQGVGRQAVKGDISNEQLDKARFMLLRVLHSPVLPVRLKGYKSVLDLVKYSVGAAQTLDTSCSRSPGVLLLLSPGVVRFLLFAGCADENKEVVMLAREVLHTLLLGRRLMSAAVWSVAAECWAACLPDLQCLADPSSSLGRAIDQVFEAVYDQDSHQALRYQLQCLFLRRREARSSPFFHACQRLKHMIADLCFDSLLYSIAIHNDLFILRQPIHIMRTCNLETEEGGLQKVVELIHGGGLEVGVQKAAWTQLSFLLEDPNLHKSFLRLCSLPFLVQIFTNMLKVGEDESVSVECVPRVVESLRLLATHSAEVRLSLLQHSTFLLALVGATLIFYEDMRMRSQASCLMALVLFQDVIDLSDGAEAGVAQLPSVPQLLAEGLHLPFIHQTRPWVENGGLCAEMRTVHHLLKEGVWPVQEFLGVVWGAAESGGVERLSSHHRQDSKDSGLLQLSERQVGWVKLSTLSLASTSVLRNVENATSHHDVKRNVAALSFRVQLMGLNGAWDDSFFTAHKWRSSFQRFLTAEPNSLVDEQLLVHVLEGLSTCIKAHSPGLSQHQDSCPPIVQLLVTELTTPSCALLQTLTKAGGTSWVACDYSVQTVQAVRLFRAAASLISCTFTFLAKCDANQSSEVFDESVWDSLSAAVTTTLLPILAANNDMQHYNLAVVGMALDVLLRVTLHGWPGKELSSHLISNSIRLISTFHLGRGRAHNSYVGRRVTLSSSLLLLHLFSRPDTDFTQVIQAASGEDSLSWLVSLWVYRDPLVASCGLNVAAALAAHTSLLHHSLTQVSGGVWAAALSYFLPEGRSCLVRASAALLLVQLMQASPSPSSPWPSPVVADVCTGESVDGLEGLMALLQHCSFYSTVLTSLSHLNTGPGQAGPPPPNQEWDLSLSCLSSFGPGDREEEGEGEEVQQSVTSIQLYEAILKLLVNLVLLGPDQVVPQLFSHGLVTLVVTQLRCLMVNIKASEPHLQATEVSLVLLRAVLRHQPAQAATIARDTGLEHLALGVLAADLLPTASLEVVAALLAGGGWGAVRVVEWVAACPSSILCPVVAALHASTPGNARAAAATFLIGLTQVVLHGREASHQGLDVSLTGALDTPAPMPGGKALCPGWELCRHIIQLVCDTQPTQEPAGLTHLLLECLKLLLLVSHSAREAAFHLRLCLLPVLTQPLQALQDKVTTVNLHITGHLLRCKEVKVEVLATIQSLEVATNWVTGGSGVEDVCETLLGKLHPLWMPAQCTPPFLKALLQFVLSSAALHQCCVLLTRTTAMPGVSVSGTRTRWPLLACVTTLVCQQLARLTGKTGTLSFCFHTLSRDHLDLALSILINCARVPECVVVMNKVDVVGSAMKWLECRAALQEGVGVSITSRVVSLLALLTTHQESRKALLRSRQWMATVQELVGHEVLQLDALRVAANMALGRHSVTTLLESGSLMDTLLEVLGEEGKEVHHCEVALVIVWALAANNQRGKAVIRQGPLRPLLKHLAQTAPGRKAELAINIMHILE